MIYLDSAATTLQKPPEVGRAMQRAVSALASPGRGGYAAAMRAAELAYTCRRAAAGLFDLEDPERVIFTSSATHGLNIAIRSLVHPGDTVVISGYEHNAVSRTVSSIPEVTVRVAGGPLFQPEAILTEFARLIDGQVAAVICNHVSNVFGYVLPVEQIARLCRARGVPFVLDASQSAGCIPISVKELGAAFVAMPGHKGLYGPQGTGLLLCGTQESTPLLTGGTGSNSAQREMPDFYPDRLEAGTHNMPGIAGLLEGIRFVRRRGQAQILRHERLLAGQMAAGLARIPGVQVYAAPGMNHQTGVVSFRMSGLDVEEAGERFGGAGIALRAGLHCAPLAHQSAGTLETGTLRASLSAFSRSCEVEQFLRVAGRLAQRRS